MSQFFEPSWVTSHAFPSKTNMAQEFKIDEISAIPMGDLGDKIIISLHLLNFRGEMANLIDVNVLSSGQSQSVARYDGNKWSWRRGAGYVLYTELVSDVCKSDADALCMNFMKYSDDFCHNQAVHNFWAVHDLPFWERNLKRVEQIFPVACVLFL